MVQRKSPNKLGIQADSNKPDTRVTVSEPSCSQPPEVRNKGGAGSELKKMMKKSGSIKRSDFDILRSNSTRRGANTRVDKHLAAAVATQKPSRLMVTPQKGPQVKISENSPSYMKPTSSSSARKERERAQVSTRSSVTPNTKNSITPTRKPGRNLAKLASIKPVRILTKTFSIKPRRISMKKNSDQEVRRATCSSTLKDSKFPPNVNLHSGGTESEGTSVMKVCPYTYCSLNGHHHPELPPIKSFVAAKRRLLKTQKSIRLKNLPSMRRRSSGKPKEDVSRGQTVHDEDPAIPEEEDWDSFMKFYAQPEENTTKPMRRNSNDGKTKLKNLFSFGQSNHEDSLYSERDGVEADVKNGFPHYAESLSDDSSYSTVSFGDYIDRDIESIMEEMDALLLSNEYVQTEENEDYHLLCTTQIETGPGNLSKERETGECEISDSRSDKSTTDCKGEAEDRDITKDAECSIPTINGHDQIVCLHGMTNTEEIPSNGALQFVHVGSNGYLQEEFHGPDQNLEKESSSMISNEESNTSNCRSHQDSLPSAENSTSHTHDKHESQLEEHEYDPSELEMHHRIVLEDSNVDTEVHLFLPEENVVGTEAEGTEEKEEWLEKNEWNIFISEFSDEESYTEECNLKSVKDCSPEGVEIEVEDGTGAEQTTTDDDFEVDEEHLENYSNNSKRIRRKRETEEPKEPRDFNPRGPRFLPLDPEEDPETVDLRHQTIDERRNSEEWMVDYALRETVRKLTPARSKKVKLLVEAFETVPIPDYETHLPHTQTDFGNTSFMQSCN